MPRSFEHMLQYVSEQIEVPAQPHSLGACVRAIAKMYAAAYAIPGPAEAMETIKREALTRLGAENIARVESIADAWRTEEPWPRYQ
jgi:hypothetical protein